MTGIPHDTSADRDPDARGDGSDDRLVGSLVALADRATADLPHDHRLSPDAVLATRAAALGRRRLRIRTASRTGGVLVAASVLVAGAVTVAPERLSQVPVVGALVPRPAQVDTGFDRYAHLMDRSTRGTLADDASVRAEAFDAWATGWQVSRNREQGVFDDLRGEPHLVWAGPTPTGPAAVVAQRAYLRPHEGLDAADVGERTLLGFVVTGVDGKLRLAADDYAAQAEQVTDDPARRSAMVGVWLDQVRSRLLVVDLGLPLVWSTRWNYRPDGSLTRDWAPVTFADGAAVIARPRGVDASLVQVARTPVRVWADVQRLGPDRRSAQVVPTRAEPAATLPWADRTRCLAVGLAGLDEARCDAWVEALVNARIDRVGPGGLSYTSLPGRLVGRTSDGRTFVVATVAQDTDSSRLVAGVLTGTAPDAATGSALVDAGVLDPDAALPVAVRLPERQGWVVANVGATLHYRATPSDAWTDAGADAALLPDAATLQVEVTPAGGRPEVVTLGS